MPISAVLRWGSPNVDVAHTGSIKILCRSKPDVDKKIPKHSEHSLWSFYGYSR